ncbi:MAG: hypothetical protein OER04_02225 [Cyclobacteriaceae bacterium]|nr:hypothetical protein [Cyclobacteriaceae bacterium]
MIITDYNKLKGLFFTYILCGMVVACTPKEKVADDAVVSTIDAYGNPAAAGFDTINSHPKAIAVADQVMESMGGRAAWDQTRYLAWDFFGARKLIWDKQDGRVRIDFPDSSVYLVNVNDLSGKVLHQGEAITQADSLAKYIERAKNIWINDSYWLVMPFKLKDSGVTLKYLEIEETLDGTMSHVLELTFRAVGVTPQNKYLVYVDTSNNLVNQWAYYRESDQDSANFILPWGNYQDFGSILLSDDRGERDLSELAVFETLPDEVFTSFEPVNLENDH